MIKCVMFDFGNVIGIFDTLRWYDFIRKHRRNCLDPREMFSGSLKQDMRDFDLGKISEDEYYSRTSAAYQMSVPQNDFFDMLGEGVLRIDREMLGLVNYLGARGVTTILITNMNPYHARFVSERYSEVFESFDELFISSKEGIAKPDPKAWIRPMERCGLKGEECVFIDDFATNIKAASGLNINSWYYNVTDKHYCMNGKLEKEKAKFKKYLEALDVFGLM